MLAIILPLFPNSKHMHWSINSLTLGVSEAFVTIVVDNEDSYEIYIYIYLMTLNSKIRKMSPTV